MLTSVRDELTHSPFYYVLDAMANVIHTQTPALIKFRSALISAGFQVSGVHTNARAIKTNAPNSVIWDLMRCWHRLNPSKEGRLSPQSAAATILSKEPSTQADFSIRDDARTSSAPRFILNPAGWGPKTRAGKQPTSKAQMKRPNGVTKRDAERLTKKSKQDDQ